MSYGTCTPYGYCTPDDLAPIDGVRAARASRSRRALLGIAPGACALAISAIVGTWMLYARPDTLPAAETRAAQTVVQARHDVVQGGQTVVHAVVRSVSAYGALFDPGFASQQAPANVSLNALPPSAFRWAAPNPAAPPVVVAEAVVGDPGASANTDAASQDEPDATVSLPAVPKLGVDVPLPMPRPRDLRVTLPNVPFRESGRRVAAAPEAAAPPSTPSDYRGFFQKLFGGAPTPSTGPALAYAAPEDGLVLPRGLLSGRTLPAEQSTAVYDISAHTVYLPNGARLEAHSGLGVFKDDPRSVAEHMRGVTPPNLYDLTPREALFHGVRALRLTPTGGTTYGRGGLLTHSYMLRGRSGESNGCVVFRDYDAFLRAYDSGQIRQLRVVASLN